MAAFHPLFLCFLLLLSHCYICYGDRQGSQQHQQSQQCRLENLRTLKPARRSESEGGSTEYFDENDEQLQCAGLFAFRRSIQPRGLLLPSYANAPDVVYFSQGKGVCGIVVPGCPETFQASQQQSQTHKQQEGSQSWRADQHQRIQNVKQGDIIAVPAGTPYWCYNDGESPLVALTIMRTSSDANQLHPNRRHFLLAGSEPGSQQQESSGNNVFSGFDVEFLANALGINRETAQKLQSSKKQQQRGEIFRVEKGLGMVRPEQREESESEEEEQKEESSPANGLEQAFCTLRFKANIDNPSRADVFSPRAGRITILNNQRLPILNAVQLTVVRGVLNQNALTVPLWHINAHSLIYVTKGRGRVQIVGDQGKSVFDEELEQEQMVVVPQNYAVIKQARSERFEWISFRTHENALHFPITGKLSLFSGLPEDVIAESYSELSREEARTLKDSRREEFGIVSPRSQQGKDDDA